MQPPAISKVSADLIRSLDAMALLHLLGRRNVGPGGAYGLRVAVVEIFAALLKEKSELRLAFYDANSDWRESVPACVTGSRKPPLSLRESVEQALKDGHEDAALARVQALADGAPNALLAEAGFPALLDLKRCEGELREAVQALPTGAPLALVCAVWRQRPSELMLREAAPILCGDGVTQTQIEALLATRDGLSVSHWWQRLESMGVAQLKVSIGASRYTRRNQWLAEDGKDAAVALINALDHPAARTRFLAFYDHLAHNERFYGFVVMSGAKR